jgi:hypothetical protein
MAKGILLIAVYDDSSSALNNLERFERVFADKFKGKYDAAVVDYKVSLPHIAKRADRPSVRVIKELLGGGMLPSDKLKEATQKLQAREAALIVVGEPTTEAAFDEAVTRDVRTVRRAIDLPVAEVSSELATALKEALRPRP